MSKLVAEYLEVEAASIRDASFSIKARLDKI